MCFFVFLKYCSKSLLFYRAKVVLLTILWFCAVLYLRGTTKLVFAQENENVKPPEKTIIMTSPTNATVNATLDKENYNKFSFVPGLLYVKEFLWLIEAAVSDYREAVRQDFVERMGRPDAFMTSTELRWLAERGRLLDGASAEDYLVTHDRDGDRRLTMDEFVPSPKEVAASKSIKAIVSCFTRGLPYPTGQKPLVPALSYGLDPAHVRLFATPSEIEKRIEAYAERIGGSVYRRPDGRLGALDAKGNPIEPLPVDVVPLTKEEAEKHLKKFLEKIGGTGDFRPDRPAIIRDSNGVIVPPEKWPPFTQPPYHPPE